MHNCDLKFADINFHLESEFEIEVDRESLPFLLQEEISNKIKKSGITIRFCLKEKLPMFANDALWIQDKLYTFIEQHPVMYIRNMEGNPPHIFVRYTEKIIDVFYLEKAEKELKHTRSLLNVIGIEKILLDHDAFLLHSSFLNYQGKGILFSASCGVGKSTQAKLWEQFKNSETLNGDRAGIRLIDQKWMAYGMPFAGTSGIYKNDSVPVTAIVILEQYKENKIRRLTPMEAIRKLLPEISCRRWDGEFMSRLFDLLVGLVQKVPVYLLQCRPDEEAVEVLYNTLVKEEFL